MTIRKPLISILCPCFNHEKYVEYFLDSILSQDYDNFEIVIVDDCSTDSTVEKIKKYYDKRINLICNKVNMGVNAALNIAFEHSKGEYLIFIASDDLMKQDYLTKVAKIFTNSIETGVIYSSLTVIDENNNVSKQPDWVILKERNKFEILSDLFYSWNVLFSPGMAVKREIFQKIYPLDLSLVQHQDYFMHINLLLETEPKILTEPYILYRQASNHNSLSSRTISATAREKIEMFRLMNSFLKIDNLEILQKILKNPEIELTDKNLIPYYIALSALKSQNLQKREWGYLTLMEFISKKENFLLLNSKLGFNFAKYLSFSKYLYNNTRDRYMIKYKKYKKLFNIFLVLFILLSVLLIWFIAYVIF